MGEAPRKQNGTKLVKVRVNEMAFVDEGANNKRFHIMKRNDGQQDIAKAVESLDALLPDSDPETRQMLKVIKARLLKQGSDDAAKAPDLAALADKFTEKMTEVMGGLKHNMQEQIDSIQTQLEAMRADKGSSSSADAGDDSKDDQGKDKDKGADDQAGADPLDGVDQAEIDEFIAEQAEQEVEAILTS